MSPIGQTVMAIKSPPSRHHLLRRIVADRGLDGWISCVTPPGRNELRQLTATDQWQNSRVKVLTDPVRRFRCRGCEVNISSSEPGDAMPGEQQREARGWRGSLMNDYIDASDLGFDEKFAIGQPVARSEDPVLLRGEGHYSDDVSLPRQAYAVMLPTPYAHALIQRIDTGAARAMPGVLAIYTAAALAN